ncbi:hypothetical protein NFI96_008701 [Prochilodus magdalenae]|nr:hypothetical protein NFI96_008701 [Prochilodus magdalenae]
MEPHPASRRRLCELVEANELCDVWRTLHAEQRQYTWTHFKDCMLSLARLDRLKPRVKPRSAYWHFNTALLDDANFRESFIFFWDTFRLQKPSFSSGLEWWDMAKIQTRVFCQQYTLNVTRDIARSLKALEMEIVELQNLGGDHAGRQGRKGWNRENGQKRFFMQTVCGRSQGISCRRRGGFAEIRKKRTVGFFSKL